MLNLGHRETCHMSGRYWRTELEKRLECDAQRFFATTKKEAYIDDPVATFHSFTTDTIFFVFPNTAKVKR